MSEALSYARADSRLGVVLVASSRDGLRAVLLGDVGDELVADLGRRFPDAQLEPGDAAAEQLATQVARFVDEPDTRLDLALDPVGSDFQLRVWDALRQIPAGETRTYAEVAEAIGAPGSARAVASACAANHLAVIVPCHRVVRTGGALSGYRWGVERKRALLERESAVTAPLSAASRASSRTTAS